MIFDKTVSHCPELGERCAQAIGIYYGTAGMTNTGRPCQPEDSSFAGRSDEYIVWVYGDGAVCRFNGVVVRVMAVNRIETRKKKVGCADFLLLPMLCHCQNERELF